MSAAIPPEPRTGTGLEDCFTDPGPLSIDDAIRAMGIHHSCPQQCRVLHRANDILSEEYVAVALPPGPSSDPAPASSRFTTELSPEEIAERDRHFANRLREVMRLTAKAQQRN
ncbi:hypothetical protein OG874_35640 [Nocardia sp. NBC_00565]|uniref:hypothetical protein n=1 Tax=Nocardia sp. NBC_00565 TaxID=2975993 RepID=UPI002E8159D4|nr:hypothetical protein [Nocardia sp. NBC_00565]WUC02024.1 hypothetical protein OG874_35640 [Nocardia sp. NBC_00565]